MDGCDPADELKQAYLTRSGFTNSRCALLGAFGLAAAASALPAPAKGQVTNSGPLMSAGILARISLVKV